jgi:inhibitor of cysteine peptidase
MPKLPILKIITILSVCHIGFVLAAPAAKIHKIKTQVSNIPEKIYTEEQTNITISAKEPIFTLKLKSNPTTGYSWFLREYNANIIIPVKRHFEKNTDVKLMGAPGFELWTFKMKPQGFAVPQQTTLRFVYTRPWQGNDTGTQLVFHISTIN